jgi:general secretion pathway protein D
MTKVKPAPVFHLTVRSLPLCLFWRVTLRRILTVFAAFALLISLLAPLPALAKGVVLNFTDVDISTMVKFISELTGKNFVLDERVKGKVSIFSPSRLSPEEAFNVFTSVLELKGFTTVLSGRVYKIVPIGSAKQAGMKILSGKEKGAVNDAYVARVIPLENISSTEAVTFLQPVVSKDGYLASFGPSNMLLMVDSDLNVQKIQGILKIIDTSQRREGAELVFLKNASAENVANLVREWQGAREKTSSSKTAIQSVNSVSGGLIVTDARLNALVIFGTERDKEGIKKLIALVDIAPPTSSSKINVYNLENADATEAAKVLESIVKESAAPPTAQAGSAPQQSAFEGGKIILTPDKATNSLVIMASPADYQNLLQVIQKLDKRRRQVFVQAVIAEISLDKLKEYGTQISVTGGGTNGNTAAAGVFDPFNFLGGASPQSAAIVKVLQSLSSNTQIGANLSALFTNGTVNVLSTPTIMTSDNKEAEIFVGENVPFLTSTTSYSTGVAQTSNIERKDTGIILRITPQITEGDYLKLDIYQEISAVKDALNAGAAADITTTKRSAKTSVVVKDKDTVVIGGLIQDQDKNTVNKIPILGDIPLVGWLFKSKSTQRTKTNLLIMLTPRIIKSAQDMSQVSEKQKARFEQESISDKPFNLDRELRPVQ